MIDRLPPLSELLIELPIAPEDYISAMEARPWCLFVRTHAGRMFAVAHREGLTTALEVFA